MNSEESAEQVLPIAGGDGRADQVAPGNCGCAPSQDRTLREIVEHLENDPDECWHAVAGLTSVELDERLSIIDELAQHRQRPGIQALLRLLSTVRDPRTRESACLALAGTDPEPRHGPGPGAEARVIVARRPPWSAPAAGAGNDELSAHESRMAEGTKTRVARCLVGPVDGKGRGSIVISVNRMGQRRTAAFLCDLERGIQDVRGLVEPETSRDDDLFLDGDDVRPSAYVRDVPELALGLLAGCLLLCGTAVPRAVRDWLVGTVGPEFRPATFPVTIPGLDRSPIPRAEIPDRVAALLDLCPSWLDDSPLTCKLAEEIRLREVWRAADPARDAGLYRFLFEHRLIHRLELYGRMLLWMAWLWRYSGQAEQSRSALALAEELWDEQFAVPSHPFILEVTTRSLVAAQARLRAGC
jgi:hypothetical protein